MLLSYTRFSGVDKGELCGFVVSAQFSASPTKAQNETSELHLIDAYKTSM
jgi:hypothetical protein